MISFEQFLMDGSGPIYLQIIGYIKRGIAAGTIRDGDEMPSRRVLSALLGVNPNTVQKAYELLEEEGIISSRAGAKSGVSLSEERIGSIRRELLEKSVRELIASMKQMGEGREEVLALIRQYWDTEE